MTRLKNSDLPAFPISEEETDRIEEGVGIYYGISKREYFITHAPKVVPSWFEPKEVNNDYPVLRDTRNDTYVIQREIQWPLFWADSILSHLEKEQQKEDRTDLKELPFKEGDGLDGANTYIWESIKQHKIGDVVYIKDMKIEVVDRGDIGIVGIKYTGLILNDTDGKTQFLCGFGVKTQKNTGLTGDCLTIPPSI